MPAVTKPRRRTRLAMLRPGELRLPHDVASTKQRSIAVSGTCRYSFWSSDAREEGTTMDEDEFDESLDAAGVGDVSDEQRLEPVPEDGSRHSTLRRAGNGDARMSAPTAENRDSRPRIVWVRASDLLSTGTGRIAGRGLDLEADLSRRLRRRLATARRAVRERVDRLPPLAEFRRPGGSPPSFWYRLSRR